MTTTSRRAFLTTIGAGLAVAASAPVLAAGRAVRPKPADITPVRSGTVLTAEWMNGLVERVNELGELL